MLSCAGAAPNLFLQYLRSTSSNLSWLTIARIKASRLISIPTLFCMSVLQYYQLDQQFSVTYWKVVGHKIVFVTEHKVLLLQHDAITVVFSIRQQ